MKIIASLTTLPGRERSCRKTIKTLLHQRPKFKRIVVTIPRQYMRLSQTYSEVAIRKLKALSPRVRIRMVNKDYGPGLKFFGYGEKGYTFVCDDDQHYRKNTLHHLVQKAIHFRKNSSKKHVIQNSRLKHIRGFRGILFGPNVLGGFKTFLKKVPKETWEIDDDLMMAYLKRRKIPIVNPQIFLNPKRRFRKRAPAHALGKGNRARRQGQRAILREALKKL